ncbi:hypothetical protein HXX02_07745 [Microbulbifer elongatus]|uniref:Cycloisomerase n=1 Tax=Microbulbifer elongatus TaxID=86173 RepID=A0ABT1NZP0_9GAMM|nr:hypothetical protein [Microbulbifer elongatus]MCQ3829335.1 hypothetical protein [Microbulbifer elongatus]
MKLAEYFTGLRSNARFKRTTQLLLLWVVALPIAADERLRATTLQAFDTFDARQGIAVDKQFFYAVNNFRITKHRRSDGAPVLQWDGISEQGPLIHMDSGMVWEGKLYASHSNYPAWPMTSSVEVWDTNTMEHVATHSFGIELGSFTWLDRYNGHWWGAFGNYDKVQKGQERPYGQTIRTQVVKMDDRFQVLARWTLPEKVLERIAPMSNSGGSWGPDGYLYLTGHDHPEIYVMQIPAHGSELRWVATIDAPEIHGQGIAWDRSSDQREIWGIRKRDRKVFRMQVPQVTAPDNAAIVSRVRGPGQFKRD